MGGGGGCKTASYDVEVKVQPLSRDGPVTDDYEEKLAG
jgi:hypothetical protein